MLVVLFVALPELSDVVVAGLTDHHHSLRRVVPDQVAAVLQWRREYGGCVKIQTGLI